MKMQKEDWREKLEETFFRDGDQVTHRTDWSLIFHAILFEAFFGANASPDSLAIGIFGLITAYLWFFIGWRQYWNIRHVHDCLVDLENLDSDEERRRFHTRLKLIREKRQPKLFGWVQATPVFSFSIPLAALLTWATLVLHLLYAEHCVLLGCFLLFIAVPVLSWLSIKLARKTTEVDKSLVKEFLEPASTGREIEGTKSNAGGTNG